MATNSRRAPHRAMATVSDGTLVLPQLRVLRVPWAVSLAPYTVPCRAPAWSSRSPCGPRCGCSVFSGAEQSLPPIASSLTELCWPGTASCPIPTPSHLPFAFSPAPQGCPTAMVHCCGWSPGPAPRGTSLAAGAFGRSRQLPAGRCLCRRGAEPQLAAPRFVSIHSHVANSKIAPSSFLLVPGSLRLPLTVSSAAPSLPPEQSSACAAQPGGVWRCWHHIKALYLSLVTSMPKIPPSLPPWKGGRKPLENLFPLGESFAAGRRLGSVLSWGCSPGWSWAEEASPELRSL